jgi:hypothetical protein
MINLNKLFASKKIEPTQKEEIKPLDVKRIKNGLLYSTLDSERICNINRSNWLYKTKNDRWFLLRGFMGNFDIAPINKNRVKILLANNNKIELYTKYFGKPELA